ncbi:hypothetical protein MHU86_3827 [Fragilaria crotonensis]|nr:hypothetical protein MHU86_3827 [Fragilaria crotonensis]
MLALSDAQIHEARIDAENDFNAKLEKLREKHADELDRISSASEELLTGVRDENSLLIDRIKEMEITVDACRAEIDRNNELYEQNLEAMQSRVTSQLDSHAHELRMRLESEFEERLREYQSQAANEGKVQLDEATCRYQEEMEALRKSAEHEKDQLRRELEIEFEANAERHRADAAAKLQSAVAQAVREVTETAEQVKAAFVLENEVAEQLRALREEHAVQLKEMQNKENALREELRAAAEADANVGQAAELHRQEIEALQLSHAQEMENLRISLESAFNDAMENLKADAAANIENVLSQARQEAAQAAEALKTVLEEEKDAKVKSITLESEVAILNAVKQEKAKAAEQLEILRAALSKDLEDMQSTAKALDADLRSSTLREQALLSELNDLKARIAAAEEDRKALAEAAQSGESSSKMLEERLASQRASFEASMSALKEQHNIDKQQSLEREQELIRAKEELENEAEHSRQKIVQLEIAIDSTRKSLAILEDEFDAQTENHKGKLAAIVENHSSEIQTLKEDHIQIQTAHAAKLEETVSATEERITQLQTLLEDGANAVQNIKEQHESEMKALKEAHASELNDARKLIDEREEHLQHLSSQAATWKDTHSQLQSKLDEAQNRSEELERELLDLRRAVDEGNATVDMLKGQYVSQREELTQQYEAELNKAKVLADERENSLRQLIAEAAIGNESYAVVAAELESARNRLTELEDSSREEKRSLTLQLETLKAEKSAATEALLEAASREEVFLSQHQEAIAGLEQQLENARQQFSEREMALRERMDRAVEESQSAVQKLSEEADKLKETIATMKAEHEEALSHQERSISRSLVDNESQLAEALCTVEKEKESALEALKHDYESKLTDARDKQTKAVEIVKKLKAATAAKLQGIERERMAEKSSFEEQISNLESTLRSDHESHIAILMEDHATLTKEWEAKLAEREMEVEDSLQKARDDWETQRLQIESEHAEKISTLEEALEAANLRLQDATLVSPEEMELKLEAKANDIRAQVTTQLTAMADTHAQELERERSNAQEILRQLKMQHEEAVLRLESDKGRVLEESKQELESRLQELALKHNEEMQGLQERLAAHVDDLKRHFMEKVQAADIQHADEVKSLSEQLFAREDQLAKIARQINEKNNEYATLEKQHEALQTKFSSDVVVKQALQKKIEELQKQLTESTANGAAAAQSLLQQQERLETKAALDEELKRTVLERDTNTNKIEELQGKLEALGANLNITLDEKNEVESELQSASRKAAKLDLAESELNSLRDQLNKLKLEQTKSNSLLEKLQAEKEANTRNHGQRTALVGMLEEQLADLNEKNSELNAKLEAAKYDLSAREEDIQSLQDALENAKKGMADAQNARKQANESLSSAQKGADAKKGKMIESLQREIQSLQQQMAKKSCCSKTDPAKEAECIELRKTTKALQQRGGQG